MGLAWTDGFASYAATSDLAKKWAAAGTPWTWGSATGKSGGGGISCVSGSGQAAIISQSIFGDVNTGILQFGFYAKFTALNPTSVPQEFMEITDSAATVGGCGSLQIASQGGVGVIALYQSDTSPSLVGTKNVCDGNWHWFEVSINIANANNVQRLYIDGVLELSSTRTINNNGRFAHAFKFLRMNNSIDILGISDLTVYDNNSPSPVNADFPLGPLFVGTKRPNADSVVQFTPNSGANNFSRVNEVNGDGDTSYVESATSGNQDLYTYSALGGAIPTKIWGAMVNSYIENPAAGTQNFQAICKSGATQSNGATVQCPAGYQIRQQAFNLDPATVAGWTLAGLEAATFGVKLP